MAVLRVTNHALETIIAPNVTQLRMCASSGPLLVQRVRFASLAHRPLRWPSELQARIWESWHDFLWSANQFRSLSNPLPAHSNCCNAERWATSAIRPECTLTGGRTLAADGGCLHSHALRLSAAPAVHTTRASVQDSRRSFLCSARSDNADTSDHLPVGLILPSTEPVREPVTLPRVTEDMVQLSFARSGGAGGQNVNKVNTKVDMRFNVLEAEWLPDWVKEKLLETEANRINNDGELVVTSTRTRTQKGNIEDALEKLNTILAKASYVPPPPSAEKIKRIKKLAKAANEKRLDSKKKQSSKKADRRNKGKWDD